MDPLKQLGLTPEMLRVTAEIDEFKGRWTALGRLAPDRLSVLRRIATIESVGSSTRIEGARITNPQVDALLAGVTASSLRSRDEQEVAGYADAMELVFESWREIQLTENHVQQLHGVLLKHSERDERHRGRYKTLPNQVEAFDSEGKSLGVILEFATPFDTPRLMEELIAWTTRSLDSREHHPLLVIGIFVLRFLSIHPFLDGNGRLSRILTTLLLLRSGYEYVPYSSLERVVEDNKDDYYRALRRAQSAPASRGEWIVFFLRCLSAQKDQLARKVEAEELMTALPDLSERLLRIATDHGRVTIREAVHLTEANRNTIKAHLRRLVEVGRLRQRGRGRGTWYERS